MRWFCEWSKVDLARWIWTYPRIFTNLPRRWSWYYLSWFPAIIQRIRTPETKCNMNSRNSSIELPVLLCLTSSSCYWRLWQTNISSFPTRGKHPRLESTIVPWGLRRNRHRRFCNLVFKSKLVILPGPKTQQEEVSWNCIKMYSDEERDSKDTLLDDLLQRRGWLKAVVRLCRLVIYIKLIIDVYILWRQINSMGSAYVNCTLSWWSPSSSRDRKPSVATMELAGNRYEAINKHKTLDRSLIWQGFYVDDMYKSRARF